VILLHGFLGAPGDWELKVAPGLDEIGVQCLTPWLPGHGIDPSEPAYGAVTMEEFFEHLDELPLEDGTLVGYSMGGRLALHYALARPQRVRRLVLEAASPGLEAEGERARRVADDEGLAQAIEREGIEAFVERWEALPLFASQRQLAPEVRTRVRGIRHTQLTSGIARALRVLGTGALPSLWDRLGEWDRPTLILVGSRDTKFVTVARRMAASFADSTRVEVEGVGHNVHLEAPGPWLAAVKEFLDVEPRA
jgi:2-succinyl-6-hydroxy-2,4-cyclohexadiene-1-carboxylate synthase